MADPQTQEGRDDQAPPPNGTEQQPADFEAALARLAEVERKNGALFNENKSLKKRTEAAAALTERLKSWNNLKDKYGIEDDSELEARLNTQEQQELDKARDKGEIDKLLADKDKKHLRELAKLNEQLLAEKGLNDRVMLDAVLREELAKYCDPDLLDGAFALHRNRIKMVEDPESEYGRRAAAEYGGEHFTVPEYVKNWVETNEKAVKYLKPSLATGGGATGGASGKRFQTVYKAEMSAKAISDYIENHGRAAFEALPRHRPK